MERAKREKSYPAFAVAKLIKLNYPQKQNAKCLLLTTTSTSTAEKSFKNRGACFLVLSAPLMEQGGWGCGGVKLRPENG